MSGVGTPAPQTTTSTVPERSARMAAESLWWVMVISIADCEARGPEEAVGGECTARACNPEIRPGAAEIADVPKPAVPPARQMDVGLIETPDCGPAGAECHGRIAEDEGRVYGTEFEHLQVRHRTGGGNGGYPNRPRPSARRRQVHSELMEEAPFVAGSGAMYHRRQPKPRPRPRK